MKIAITGGLGFIGTTLVGALRRGTDAEIRILDNLSNTSGDLDVSAGIELIEGDIRDLDAVQEAVRMVTTMRTAARWCGGAVPPACRGLCTGAAVR